MPLWQIQSIHLICIGLWFESLKKQLKLNANLGPNRMLDCKVYKKCMGKHIEYGFA